MKKILTLLFCLCLLTSCENKNNLKKFNVSYFYIPDCGHCEMFNKYGLVYLKKVFGNSIDIKYYNMELDESKSKYSEVVSQLKNYNQDTQEVPFFVVDNYFAFLGYTKGEEKELASDIKKALNNQKLGDTLEMYRWEFFK